MQHRLWVWDPLNLFPPRGEYDCMIAPILRALERGGNHLVVAEVLHHELSDHFGVTPNQVELKHFAADLVEWFEEAKR